MTQIKKKTNQTKSLLKILKSNNFLENKKIGLAVSGGPDSIAMLDAFNKLKQDKLKQELKLKLYVLHYNHKWRKKSHLDSKLVKDYCDKNNIRFLYSENKDQVIKDEEIAREERYLFFKKIAKKYKLDFICTAHHKDDQVETILFRLARGTGPKGLMPIKRLLDLGDNVTIFRPFINVSKEQLLKYVKENRLIFIDDVTNKDVKYKRNLIRHKITPQLKKINKNFANNIINSCDLIYSHNVVVGEYFNALLKRLSRRSNTTVISKNKFIKLNYSIQKAFLYWFLSRYKIKGNISKLPLILNAIRENGKLDLDNNYSICSDNQNIYFYKKNINKSKNLSERLNVNLDLNGKEKKICILNKNLLILKPFNDKHFKFQFPDDSKKIAYVNLNTYTGKQLTIRNRKPKDVFQPLGCLSTIKLKKYLINKKVSRETRYNLPLLCFRNEVLWVPGYSLSEKIKVINKPTHTLSLREK